MGKIVLISLILSSFIYGGIFDKRCTSCHNKINRPLKAIFFDYLLYYSSEKRVKEALKAYLTNKDFKKAVNIKNKKKPYRHKVNINELDILLQIYWNRYKVFGKIR
jgi:hypothetical protein